MARRRALTRRRILRAALQVADTHGLQGLTMRRVAQRLGAGTMSLYHHVPGRDALLQGMLELVLEEVELPPDDLEDWIERIRHILRSFRRAILAHPSVLPIVAARQPTTPPALRAMEAGLDALRLAGFGPEAAADAYRGVASYAIGFLSLEIGGFFRLEDGNSAALAEIPFDQFPRLIELAPHLLSWDPERHFDEGITAVLLGFRGDGERRPRRTLQRSPAQAGPGKIGARLSR